MIQYMDKPYTEEQVKHILNPLVKKWFFTRFKSFSLPQLYGVMEIHSRNNILVSAPTRSVKNLRNIFKSLVFPILNFKSLVIHSTIK